MTEASRATNAWFTDTFSEPRDGLGIQRADAVADEQRCDGQALDAQAPRPAPEAVGELQQELAILLDLGAPYHGQPQADWVVRRIRELPLTPRRTQANRPRLRADPS